MYLGIIRAGCVAVCVAESFAPEEIQRRMRRALSRNCSPTGSSDAGVDSRLEMPADPGKRA